MRERHTADGLAHLFATGGWGACSWTGLIVAGVLLLLYRDKYRPALERAKTDLQISMIADLQRQIAALSQRLDDRANT